MAVEVWLRGPLPDVAPLLMPAAHARLQIREEIGPAAGGLSVAELWTRPGGAASAGFHLKHMAGSIDRLLTYARGGALNDSQLAFLKSEEVPGEPPADAASLIRLAYGAIDTALEVIRSTAEADLLQPCEVGRAKLPSTVLGLLFHIAEHTQRHVGQVVTTTKVVRGLGLGG